MEKERKKEEEEGGRSEGRRSNDSDQSHTHAQTMSDGEQLESEQ